MDLRTAKYLDPKNDLTFRKIFGQHPNITKSFLNSMLPFEPDRYIEELTYTDPGLIPELPEQKHSIVDVRCIDNFGRQFIVEMQMYWTSSFKSRMLFNAGKAYVKQIDKGHKYSELKPVYGLSLVDDVFLTDQKYKDKYYHHYRLAHHEDPDEIIKGIELVFIELPKFKAKTFTEKKLRNLWLRFLTEVDENTTEVPDELISENSIREALEHLQVSAFTKEELEYYDKYWDHIRVERTAIHDITKELEKKQEELNKVKSEIDKVKLEADKAKSEADKAKSEADKAKSEADKAKSEADKAHKKLLDTAKFMLSKGMSINEVMQLTGLDEQEIKKLI